MIDTVTVAGARFELERVLAEAEERCGERLLELAPARRGGPALFYLHPTEESWRLGDREILCMAHYEVPRRGSLRDP